MFVSFIQITQILWKPFVCSMCRNISCIRILWYHLLIWQDLQNTEYVVKRFWLRLNCVIIHPFAVLYTCMTGTCVGPTFPTIDLSHNWFISQKIQQSSNCFPTVDLSNLPSTENQYCFEHWYYAYTHMCLFVFICRSYSASISR